MKDLVEMSRALTGMRDSCRGRLQTRTWSSCLRRLGKLSLRKSCTRAHARRAAVSFNLPKYRRQRLRSVRHNFMVTYDMSLLRIMALQQNSSSICMVDGHLVSIC